MDVIRALATVTPTVDGDVLAVLEQNEATFTPRQLRRLLGRYSEAGIRKVLVRLTEHRARTPGRQRRDLPARP